MEAALKSTADEPASRKATSEAPLDTAPVSTMSQFQDGSEEEEEEWPPKPLMHSVQGDDRFFRAGESLRGKYSEVEIEQFMKLLNVKPYKQW